LKFDPDSRTLSGIASVRQEVYLDTRGPAPRFLKLLDNSAKAMPNTQLASPGAKMRCVR